MAMEDPILALTRLRRQGVIFNETEIEMVKQFVAVNKKAEAQEIILRKLETRYADFARSQMTAAKQMKKAWDEFMQAIGTKMKPVLDGLYTGIGAALQAMTTQINAKTGEMSKSLYKTIHDIAGFVGTFVIAVKSIFTLVATNLVAEVAIISAAINGIGAGVRSFIDHALNIWEALKMLGPAIFHTLGLGDFGLWSDMWAKLKEAPENFAQTNVDIWKNKILPVADLYKDWLTNTGTEIDTLFINIDDKIRDMQTPKPGGALPPLDLSGMDVGGGDDALSDAGIAKMTKNSGKFAALLSKVIALSLKPARLWAENQIAYYEEVKFADKGYYEWKANLMFAQDKKRGLSEEKLKVLYTVHMNQLKSERDAYEDLEGQRQRYYVSIQAAIDVVRELGLSWEAYSKYRAIQIKGEIDLLKEQGVMAEYANAVGESRLAGMRAEYDAMIKQFNVGQLDALIAKHQTTYDVIKSSIQTALEGIGQMITEGKKFADVWKDIWKGILANVVNTFIGLATNYIANAAFTGLFGGTPGGAVIGLLGAGAGGGNYGNTSYLPTTNSNAGIIRELQLLRRDVYQAQPTAVQMNWRKGELSYATDEDRKYRQVTQQ
jgi:hypothetical protein